jgi:hypothetical protein
MDTVGDVDKYTTQRQRMRGQEDDRVNRVLTINGNSVLSSVIGNY